MFVEKLFRRCVCDGGGVGLFWWMCRSVQVVLYNSILLGRLGLCLWFSVSCSRRRSRTGTGFTAVCLCVCFPPGISKTDAARVTELDIPRVPQWVPETRLFLGSKVKVTSRKNSAGVAVLHCCECWLLLVGIVFARWRCLSWCCGR